METPQPVERTRRTSPRQKRYAPRPERISLDWGSAFKVAIAVVLLLAVLQILAWMFFGGIAVLLAAASL